MILDRPCYSVQRSGTAAPELFWGIKNGWFFWGVHNVILLKIWGWEMKGFFPIPLLLFESFDSFLRIYCQKNGNFLLFFEKFKKKINVLFLSAMGTGF